jgi:hypothetical protein
MEYSVMGSLSCNVVHGNTDVGAISVSVPDVHGPGVYVSFPFEVTEGIQPQGDLEPGPHVCVCSLVLLGAACVKECANPWCGLL